MKFRHMMRSKIHRAVVTQADLHYEGSISIDRALLRLADILPFERVQVANIATGGRFETYAIEGPENSGMICINGAAARLCQLGDLVIIMSYVLLPEEEARAHAIRIIHVDGANRPLPSAS